MSTQDSQINLQEDFSQKLTVHKSLDQEVIVTTVEKVRLCLLNHKDRLTAKREWNLPASLLVTIITALVAADSSNVLLDAAVWQSLFILAVTASFVWLMFLLSKAWRCRKGGDIEEIVENLKAHSAPVREPDSGSNT